MRTQLDEEEIMASIVPVWPLCRFARVVGSIPIFCGFAVIGALCDSKSAIAAVIRSLWVEPDEVECRVGIDRAV